MTNPQTLHAVITGRVQGVCFRYYTRETARELGLRGWVRNLRDGRVELMATGASEALKSFKQWISHGPPLAAVTNIEMEKTDAAIPQDAFEIIGNDFLP